MQYLLNLVFLAALTAKEGDYEKSKKINNEGGVSGPIEQPISSRYAPVGDVRKNR